MIAFYLGLAVIPLLVGLTRSTQLRAWLTALIASAGGELIAHAIAGRSLYATAMQISEGIGSFPNPSSPLLQGLVAGAAIGVVLALFWKRRRS